MSYSSFRTSSSPLEWRDKDHPYSSQFDDVYFSNDNPVGESTHVFIHGNRLLDRWEAPKAERGEFCIGELGFGTGLNFLNTWHHWQYHKSRHPDWHRLHYIAFEKFPLRKAELLKIHQLWPEFSHFSDVLLNHYSADCLGWHRLQLADDVWLDLILGDATDSLRSRSVTDKKIDAWFIDGFSPAKDQALWQSDLFQLMVAHSHEQTTFSTYSSAGDIRRNLEASGFKVERITGHGKKRHMLIGTGTDKPEQQPIKPLDRPWFCFPNDHPTPSSIIVIGAGLAGANVAHAIAKRGYQVTVLESGEQLANGASGIPQLALRCRLFSKANESAQFFLQAYLYAIQTYDSLEQDSLEGPHPWHQTGVLQLNDAMNKKRPLTNKNIASTYPSNIARQPDSEELGAIAPEHTDQAIFFEQGGWVDSKALCENLLHSPLVSVKYGTAVTKVERRNDNWDLLDKLGNLVASASHVVIATGHQCANLDQTEGLPLECSIGQSTLIERPLSSFENSLECVVSGSRSVFPIHNGSHTVSASYHSISKELASASNKTRDSDDTANLSAVASIFGSGQQIAKEDIASIAAVRANTPDRLPIAGPLPNLAAMAEQYDELKRNARKQFDEPGIYHPGLYISAGHGSTGLATTPLAGEYIASLIDGGSSPINGEIMDALNPCRFLIRDLKRQS